jgi:hypothetical protein
MDYITIDYGFAIAGNIHATGSGISGYEKRTL